MKKTFGFYARVLVDVDLFSSLPQQLLVEHRGFFFADMEYEQHLPFCSFSKMIDYMLSACKHCPQSDRFDQQ